jgi:hypothetical protein
VAPHPNLDFPSSQDTHAGEINRLDISKQEVTEAEEELKAAKEGNHDEV